MRTLFSVFVFVIAASGICSSQTFNALDENGLQSYAIVNTDLGAITVDHAADQSFSERYKKQDVAIRRTRLAGQWYVVGRGKPFQTMTRRGALRRLSLVSESEFRFYVSKEFYSGESGLPVFSKSGHLVGIVVGNSFQDGRWLGIVTKVDFLIKVLR